MTAPTTRTWTSQAHLPGLSPENSELVEILAEGWWPERPGDELTGLPGFVLSTFSPLVAEVAERCLRACYGGPPADSGRGARTAVVVVSALGDLTSAVHVARAVDTGARVGPLLFFQSVPNAVAGYVAARWGLGGPVVCLASPGDAFAVAALLFEDGDADEALVVFAEQATAATDRDRARAVLVRAPEPPKGTPQ